MQFNSIGFLFAFLPVFLILYYAAGEKLRSSVMVLGSLGFYFLAGGGRWWWVALLLGLTIITYFLQRFALAGRKGSLALSLTGLAAILIFFKVYQQGRHLPAGMSFFMFQMAACMIDVFRKKCSPEPGFLAYVEQIMLFPKLLSGPIMNPAELAEQQRNPKRNLENVYEGLRILILGLALKVILANRLGGLWSQPKIIGYAYISPQAAWMALIAYAMQLYLDFYGYSLMAIGIGRMLGYHLPDNFRDPYSSRTVSEFYRRWHITLGAWFKEYVYIPLGGNRRGTVRTILNMAVVWLFTGLWHGVGGNYLLWAGFILLFMILERLWLGKYLNRSKVLSHVYLVVVILLSWIPFAVGSWQDMVIFTGRLFGLCGETVNPRDYVEWVQMYAGLLGVSALVMTPLPGKIWKKIRSCPLTDILVFTLFWVVVYYISTAAQDPFLYFQY